MSIRTRKNIVEKINIKMKKIKNVIYDVFIGAIGILIAIVMFPIALPITIYKSIINSKKTKNDK
jgi:hypothetical protein